MASSWPSGAMTASRCMRSRISACRRWRRSRRRSIALPARTASAREPGPLWRGMSTASEIAQHFPIESQSSDRDKAFLLAAKRLIADIAPGYGYLEIGSFLGGSLAPFLKDPACASILSIDERGKTLPDERGALFDYAGITTQSMLDRLHQAGLATAKLTTHDGPIDTMALPERRFDLAFIDGA